MKIKELFKNNEITEYSLNDRYYLFMEKLSNYEFGKKVSETLLIELHEIVGEDNGEYITDFVETINHNFTLETDVKELTFKKIKELATYEL